MKWNEIIQDERLSRAARAEGNVFEIQHFSIHDGPGIRSTVFLKGCPLKCLWCHNPEGQSVGKTVMLDASRCAKCGICAGVCPMGCHHIEADAHGFRSIDCMRCGKCINACPSRAMHWVDRSMTGQQVLEEVLRDRDYFEASGGGITISGGEPTLHPQFILALLQLSGAFGLHRAIETCGFARREVFSLLKDETDLFLFDIKETDPDLHRKYVGVDLEPILDNLRWMHDQKANIILRCPIIPGCNDREAHIRGIARLYAQMPGINEVELLPYHSLGVSKAMRLGMEQQEFCPPSQDFMEEARNILRMMGVPVKK